MKSVPYFLVNDKVKSNLIAYLSELPSGEDYKITISKSGTKSQRQQGLNWKWNTEIAQSGIGGYDDKNDVHRGGKKKFAIPILLRDDDLFPFIYERFLEVSDQSEKSWAKFLDDYVNTQKFSVSQCAEYLTDFQRYWLGKGVDLTNPDLYGIKI